MAYFMSTDLGREVPLEDWVGFHRDRLLSVMVQMRAMGVPYPTFQLSMIEGVTGLPTSHANNLAQTLTREGLLERDANAFRLTDAGIRWVLESPGR
jgi:DNA-binding IclR family transcriptional regulator